MVAGKAFLMTQKIDTTKENVNKLDYIFKSFAQQRYK